MRDKSGVFMSDSLLKDMADALVQSVAKPVEILEAPMSLKANLPEGQTDPKMLAKEAVEGEHDTLRIDLAHVTERAKSLETENAALKAENERLSRQHDQCHDTNNELVKEHVRLKVELAKYLSNIPSEK